MGGGGQLFGSFLLILDPRGAKSGQSELKTQNENEDTETCRFALLEVLLQADLQSGHETHLLGRVSRALRVRVRAPKRGAPLPRAF